jgi:hypothetical protein
MIPPETSCSSNDDQLEVISTYKDILVDIKNKNFLDDPEMYLRQFFSPHRVPKGLTKAQIRMCILLYPLRPVSPDHLPALLTVPGPISHVDFKKGIAQFLANVAIELAAEA